MNVGIFNLYWSTFGGGEQQAGGIADALTGQHHVELLGPDNIDLAVLRQRLGLKLDGVTTRKILSDPWAATAASADYDVFINHTYLSTAPNLARRGVYFVMFPGRLDQIGRRQRVVRKAHRLATAVRALGGVLPRPNGDLRVVGPVMLHVRADTQSTLSVGFRSAEAVRIETAIVEQRDVRQSVEMFGSQTITVQVPAGPSHVLFSPQRSVVDPDDLHRALNIDSCSLGDVRIDIDPRKIRQRLAAPDPTSFLDTYDTVVCLSQYTQHWTQQWWGRGDVVISPPVALRSPGTKQRLIVAVGRFFAPTHGHSKNQLQLVHAFRQLCELGHDDWKLVLIGGCSPEHRDYAMQVRRAAAGLPIEVRLNAPADVLNHNLAAATFFWHAAGLDTDISKDPAAAEHFGIAPIEAMSTGAVPIVYGQAGPKEVVEDNVSGMHFDTVQQLAATTDRLIRDPHDLARLSAGAIARAQLYDAAHFADNVRALINQDD